MLNVNDEMVNKCTTTDDYLGFWWSVRRSLDTSFCTPVENSWDPIRFRQNGTVAEAEGEAETQPQYAARKHGGHSKDRDRH